MADKPIVLTQEDVQRLIGKDAQRNNILAAKMVADIVKTTLGPKGMDKMLVSPLGDIIITNDGVTILEERSRRWNNYCCYVGWKAIRECGKTDR